MLLVTSSSKWLRIILPIYPRQQSVWRQHVCLQVTTRKLTHSVGTLAKRRAQDDTSSSVFAAHEIVTNFDLFKSDDDDSKCFSSATDYFKSNRLVFLEEEVHPASLPVDQLLQDCEIQRTKRGGPGGQHRNKTCTTVVITHKKTRVSAEGHERRNQLINMKVGIQRLRCQLACKVRTMGDPTPTGKKPFVWEPSELLLERCARNGKIVLSGTHDDYPAVLANVLDGIFWARFEITKSDSPVIERINERRAASASTSVTGRLRSKCGSSSMNTTEPATCHAKDIVQDISGGISKEAIENTNVGAIVEKSTEEMRKSADAIRPVKANEIINLLFKYPAAIQLVNLEREHLGMFRLRKRT
eukprot:m.150841 g.150841  ORF g.150841 m.150841 type:complete len:357 (+) comp17835_c0_seq1:277-1347(+)